MQVAHQQVEWQVGTYVRVYGHLRSLNNQLRIHCFNIKPILDFNEVGRSLSSHNPHMQLSAGPQLDHVHALPDQQLWQVTYHLMQCVFQHVYYTKGAQGSSGATAAPVSRPAMSEAAAPARLQSLPIQQHAEAVWRLHGRLDSMHFPQHTEAVLKLQGRSDSMHAHRLPPRQRQGPATQPMEGAGLLRACRESKPTS